MKVIEITDGRFIIEPANEDEARGIRAILPPTGIATHYDDVRSFDGEPLAEPITAEQMVRARKIALRLFEQMALSDDPVPEPLTEAEMARARQTALRLFASASVPKPRGA